MRKIKESIFEVGAIDWDRRLFDKLIPTPDGTTYNAYLIKGSEKTALLDTVDPPKADVLFSNLAKADVSRIDYLVAHHAEQDHSGTINEVLMLYPEAKVVTNEKCKSMLMDHLETEEDKFIVVEDSQSISLGGKTLTFMNMPWVHWPETMVTYLAEDKILFSCDFFGSHLATNQLYAEQAENVYESAKRYYAEIMMPFRTHIKKHLARLADYEIDIIAPSHGPLYDNPEYIINAYKDWVSDDVKNEVVLPYVSMHDSTKTMVDHFVEALTERGIVVRQFNLAVTDLGKLAMALVDAATVVIGTGTVLTGAHPLAAYACFLANALRPKTRFASLIGSYGWGGKMPEQIQGLLSNMKVEFLEPVIAKGLPKQKDFAAIDELADKILSKHKEIGIIK
ncbi:MAG: FprA family A-type flavoprotein [Sedimentisphaerales bacterium]|nr:FprA family A-type flavoprotein [Sedimentisphaerales bacterium]